MSIDVTAEMIEIAQRAIESKNPYSKASAQGLLTSVKKSLPAYWRLYSEQVASVEGWSDSVLAVIYRGLASDAIQRVTSEKFGFRLHRVGKHIVSTEVSQERLETDGNLAQLQADYPLGMKLVQQRIEENAKGQNGTVWDPIGTDAEPNADEHLELLGALSDARLKSWLSSQGIRMYFRNCCTTLTETGSGSDDLCERIKLFTSPAAQLLNQHESRKALHC